MRDALSILDMCIGYGRKIDESLVQTVLGTSDRGFLFRFSSALAGENAAEALRLIDELMRNGREPSAFARSVCDHLRTLLMAKCCGADIADVLDLTDETAADYVRGAEGISASRLMEMLDLFIALETDIKSVSSPRIALENVALKCCLRTAPVDTLALNDRIAELENRISQLQELLKKGVRPASEPKAEGEGEKPSAKKASAEGQPKPAAKKKPVAADDQGIWAETVKQLLRTEPMIGSFLRSGQLVGVKGAEYRWQANPGFEMTVPQLNSPDRKSKIEAALSEAAGSPCTFAALDRNTQAPDTGEESDDDYTEELADTFGRAALQVVEDIPPQG